MKMKKKLAGLIAVCALLIVYLLSTVAYAYIASDEKAASDKEKTVTAPVVKSEEQMLLEKKEVEEKAAALADYVPQEEPVPDYFYQMAEKLGVDIDGLEPNEIMNKVKAAEEEAMQQWLASLNLDSEKKLHE